METRLPSHDPAVGPRLVEVADFCDAIRCDLLPSPAPLHLPV